MILATLSFDDKNYTERLTDLVKQVGKAHQRANDAKKKANKYYVKPPKYVDQDKETALRLTKKLNALQKKRTVGISVALQIDQQLEDLLDSIDPQIARRNSDLLTRVVDQAFQNPDEHALLAVKKLVTSLLQGPRQARPTLQLALERLKRRRD